ncbi:MAG: sigma-70 family RNA polymerase sigma factor [Alphaproteobacteria bacterium]|nr:sigma-70 family RNA polymerase sigma factor [Alphaproteobacteria bacterium]
MICAIAENEDKEAFIALFEHFAPRIKSFLMKGGANPELADELAQETMLTIWNKAERYNPKQAAASTWIFTIARNKRIDSIRKTKRYDPDPSDPILLADDGPSPRQHALHKEEMDVLAKALETLPEEQAELVKKSFFEDKSHAVIAEETGIPLGTVKSRIRLALERLRGDSKVQDIWQ